jgi:outer membrane protein assembly factor BamB
MKRTTLALTLTFSLLFSAMAGTSLLNVTGANKACSAPIAHFYQSAVGSAISDNDAEASSPELSPEELWNFTVANYTANTLSFGWRRPNVENGIAYLCNTESYIIPGEPHVPLLDIPVTHSLGTVRAINITSGEELWNLTGAGDHFYFATVDGVAYISASDSRVTNGQSAGGRLYALDAANGTLKWSHHFNGVIHWFPINEGLVYVFFQASDSNGHHSYVCALNTSDGSQFWRWEADYSYLSYPAVGDGAIYFGT